MRGIIIFQSRLTILYLFVEPVLSFKAGGILTDSGLHPLQQYASCDDVFSIHSKSDLLSNYSESSGCLYRRKPL